MPTGIAVAQAKNVTRFRSGLLVGASAWAIITSSAAASAQNVPPADQPKWSPYITVGAQAGDQANGARVIGFDPLWQNLNSMLYLRLGMGTQTNNGLIANFGFGYRTRMFDDWIGGLFAGIDSSKTRNDHSFEQGSIGAELMNPDWDVRINGYLPFQTAPQISTGAYSLLIRDTTIAVLQGQETAYSGFDGEVGYRVFNTDDVDVRLFAGGFSFTGNDAKFSGGGSTINLGAGKIQGPVGGAEIDLYDLDLLGRKSRLIVTGQVSHDDVRGTTGFAGISLQIPMDDSDSDSQDEFDRRMVDPVRRMDNVLTAGGYANPEPVIIYNGTITSEPTNTLYYVDNHTGAGSYASPTTLHDAAARGPHNQFIVLTDRDGPVNASGVVVQSGETVVGPGTFTVRGIGSGVTFTHDFAPGSGHVTVKTTDPNGITVQSNTNLYGFTIDGPFTNAIYGHNVTGVVIGGVTIAGGGTGTNGIYLLQDNGNSSTNAIYSTTIDGVTGDGIKLVVDNGTGSTATNNIHLTNITATAGNDGVELTTTSSGGSNETTYLGIHDSTLTGGNADVSTIGTVNAGSSLTQTLLVDPTHLTGGAFGLVAGGIANGGSLTQTIDLSQVYVSGVTNTGIDIYATALNSGTLNQTTTMDHVSATGSGGDNIELSALANTAGILHQYATLTDVTATNSLAGSGIVLSGSADGATVVQGVDFGALTLTGNDVDGIDLTATATAGTIQQTVSIDASTLEGNTGSGLYAYGLATGGTPANLSIVGQYITITNSTFSSNTVYGAEFTTLATGASDATTQQISITGSTLSGNHVDGVNAFAAAYNAASATQSLYFNDDTIDNNLGDGVFVEGLATNQGFTKQTLEFGYVTGLTTEIDGNTGDGIYVGASTFSAGNIYQSVLVYDVDASHNQGSGLATAASSNGYGFGSSYIYYSHISQNTIAAYDTFTYNGKHGVSVTNITYYGGVLDQLVQLYSVTASHNTDAGFYEISTQTSIRGNSFAFSTNQSSNIYLVNSTFDNNGVNGIDLRSYADGAVYAPAFFGGYSYLTQHIQVTGSDISNNTGIGLKLDAQQSGRYSLNAEYLTLANSTFDHNTDAGAQLSSTSYYGPGGFGDTFEQITVSGSDFSHNGADGIDLNAFSSGRQGRAEQHATITDSTFDYNGADGVHVYASATDGTYVAGFPCTVVQGLAGGCAFVRQNVTIEYSDISHNDNNGVFVGTYADTFGAIYGASGRPHAATLELYGVTADHNGGRGMDISNHVTNSSYLYQYVASIDSNFDHNASDGVYAASYVGGASTMLERNLLYSFNITASAAYNAGNGFKSSIETLGGSYGRDVNIVEGAVDGVDLSHNGSFGFDGAVAYADGTSTGLQINAVYSNTINYNGDGVGLYSIGAGAQQLSYIGSNEVGHNSFVGVYGEANFGAFQYIGVYTFGNNVHDNGTDYLFNAFGGSTQILN